MASFKPLSEPLASDADAHWWGGFGAWDQEGLNAEVWAMTVFQGKLVAGGYLTKAGGVPARRVAIWDGTSWSALRGGIDDWDCPEIECLGHIKAMTVWDSSLVVGGSFPSVDGGLPASCIARWDGARWNPLGLGVNAPVWALTVYKGDLIAAGEFTQASGLVANHIARWDGQHWYPVAGGLSGFVTLNDLIVYGEDLIVSGPIAKAGEVDVSNIARWDGTRWYALGSGLSNPPSALCLFEGELLVSGVSWAGGMDINGMARWDGTSWGPFGPPNGVIAAAAAVYNGKLIIAGQFTSIGNRISRWTGTAWEPMGSGLDDFVSALVVQENSLYAGGRFLTAGGKPSSRIARWDDVITPVLVQDLMVAAGEDGLRVTWRLAYEAADGLIGVHVQRADASSGPFANRTPAPLEPESEMTFEDHDVEPGRPYWYRLLLLQQNGVEATVGPVQVAPQSSRRGQDLQVVAVLGSTGPIEIRYTIERPSMGVRVGIHDVLGRDLLCLDLGPREPGTYVATWDTRDRSGRSVPSGVYFVRLQANQACVARKIALVR